jgi:hypothetical protein
MKKYNTPSPFVTAVRDYSQIRQKKNTILEMKLSNKARGLDLSCSPKDKDHAANGPNRTKYK